VGHFDAKNDLADQARYLEHYQQMLC